MDKKNKSLSKFLSYLLRHNPAQIGLTLDEQGWANTEELLEKINNSGTTIDLKLLTDIVTTNDKKRFAFNEDQSKIRANQGHSITVELDLEEKQPPDLLYHGTTSAFLDSILEKGITKQSRHHVHMSQNMETAKAVGSRHGKLVLLVVNAGKMYHAGHKFFRSENEVWLTDMVPPEFFSVM